MEQIIPYVIAIILVAVAFSLLRSLLPEGHIKNSAQFVYGVILTVLICIPIVNLKDMQFGDIHVDGSVVQAQQAVYMKQAIGIQVRQVTGFKNAQVDATFDNGELSSVYIKALKTDSGDALSYEKNKSAVIQLLTVLYDIDENKIYIETDA